MPYLRAIQRACACGASGGHLIRDANDRSDSTHECTSLITSIFSARARMVMQPMKGSSWRSGTLILPPVKQAVGLATYPAARIRDSSSAEASAGLSWQNAR